MLAIILTALSTFAEVPAESKNWHDHIQYGKNNYEMKMKAIEAVNALKTRVKEIIAVHHKRLDDHADQLLSSEQSLWEKWAKARAELLCDTYRGGSHKSLSYSYELIDLYKKRIGQLKQLEQDQKP